MDYSKALEEFKWRSNPFSFNIIPELFVGYEKEANSIISSLRSGDKFSLLLGPTGSGKTTLLKFLLKEFDDYDYVLYLPKPPKDPNDWLEVFRDITKKRFLSSIFSRGNGPDLYHLSEEMNKQLKSKKCLLFVDESHEASLDSLEWLRTITDQTTNLSVVLAGLPVFESILKNDLETFMRRFTTRVELTNLKKSETRELIKKRIENMGGEDIKPFTSSCVEFIYEKTGGFPRDVLKLCNDLTQKAIEKRISTIDLEFLKEAETPVTRISMDTIKELPEKQKLVFDALAKNGELTPSEIISRIESDKYKDKENAVRSINNLLKRLMKDKLVERKRVGKTYKYNVSARFKTLMVEA